MSIEEEEDEVEEAEEVDLLGEEFVEEEEDFGFKLQPKFEALSAEEVVLS